MLRMVALQKPIGVEISNHIRTRSHSRMRHSEQLSLTAPWSGHVHAAELAAISEILDSEARIAAFVEQDLIRTAGRTL
jgi:hypothetical protein